MLQIEFNSSLVQICFFDFHSFVKDIEIYFYEQKKNEIYHIIRQYSFDVKCIMKNAYYPHVYYPFYMKVVLFIMRTKELNRTDEENESILKTLH